MAAPVAGFIKLADDTNNNGKQPRIQTRVVGGENVVEHFFIPISPRSKRVFHYSTARQSIQAAAQDAVTTGFFWLQNPAGNPWDAVIRKLAVHFGSEANTLTLTSPRLLLARFTFTGTPSGGTIPPARRKSADAPNTDVRTAVTGMTVTLGATIATFLSPNMHAAGQVWHPPVQVWPDAHDPFEDDDVILAPGEGALLYQPDAGTTSDPRRFIANMLVEEVER